MMQPVWVLIFDVHGPRSKWFYYITGDDPTSPDWAKIKDSVHTDTRWRTFDYSALRADLLALGIPPEKVPKADYFEPLEEELEDKAEDIFRKVG